MKNVELSNFKWGIRFLMYCMFCAYGNGYAQLPNKVRADLLETRILDAAKRNDDRAALAAIAEYRTLQEVFPHPLLFVEAQAAHRTKDHWRALKALTAYLTGADRNSAQYRAAVGVHEEYTRSATLSFSAVDLSTKRTEELLSLALGDAKNAKTESEGKCGTQDLQEYSMRGCIAGVRWETGHYCQQEYLVGVETVLSVDLEHPIIVVALADNGADIVIGVSNSGQAQTTYYSGGWSSNRAPYRVDKWTQQLPRRQVSQPSDAAVAKSAYEELARRCKASK